ncbi:putative P450 monooxygenase [Cryomyces antarcticus]|uniref:Cytochrome P450 n=1 Tax=Cryomyces antarcticus TaxID=329879 RepID=A0ABR0M7U1_9PEZI|nr:hypothetical protein LTR16_001963 [Cryomyces antarcticus]
MESLSFSAASLLLAFATAVYVVGGAINRLFFSPVAKFPGPRLAALTFWYEFYYDVVRNGRYTWKIEEMHEKYGPIVRINPYELHVNDPEFYDEIYVGPSRRTEKWSWSAKMFGTSLAAVGTTGHELHKLRRSALNPFFSKRSVTQLEPVIQENIDRLCTKLRGFAGTSTSVNLVDVFTCLSADVIGSYAFGQSYGFLEAPKFYPGWHKLMMDLSRSSHLMKQFGWLYSVMTLLPERLVSLLHPVTEQLFKLQNGIAKQVCDIQAGTQPSNAEEKAGSAPPHPTILHDLLQNSKLPSSELTVPRLKEEGFTLLGAGTVTTAWTLTTICYHILATPSILRRLRNELRGLYSSSDPSSSALSWQTLEHLPYLSAVVAEGLRLSYGVSHRLQRVSPDTALRLGDAIIPPGTPVSMTQMQIHLDSAIFPSPHTFAPERWLTPTPTSPPSTTTASVLGDTTLMKRFLVPFSRGSRMCVGMNLAYAEIYLTLGALFGPRGGVEMELYETSRRDVDVVHDFFNPAPAAGSRGVRVRIR